ncbi:ciliary-associated calcium-binding coiled-coil protein 1-like isoform X2 [Rhopilema esculentum]|uniref:ciliary-associated calcium-binding coiled-coil protein 1-like isoform X2 n=1 Tax=Rhopilema esculentum TaxID=499914 RepID=UPI0031DB40CC
MAAALSTSLGKSSRMNISQTNVFDQEKQSLVEEDLPPSIEGHPLAWKKFEDEEVEKLKKLNPPELERILAEKLDLKNFRVCLVDGAKLDYYVGGFLFAAEEKFDNFQISCIMGLLKEAMTNCELKMSLERNVQEIISYFVGTNKKNLENVVGMERFSVEQAKKIVDFVNQGIFQHYTLYQNLFMNQQEEEFIQKMLEIEVLPTGDLPFPPPLHEGMPIELYEKYISPPPTQVASLETDGGMEEENLKETEKDITEGGEAEPISQKSKHETSAEMILKTLKPEEIKQIVASVAQGTLENIKAEADMKIKEREAALASKISKLHRT